MISVLFGLSIAALDLARPAGYSRVTLQRLQRDQRAQRLYRKRAWPVREPQGPDISEYRQLFFGAIQASLAPPASMLFVWAFLFVYIIVGRTLYEPAGCILSTWNVLPAAMCPVNRLCQHILVVNAGIDEECVAPETEIIKFGLSDDA
jgi:hypothetical protein